MSGLIYTLDREMRQGQLFLVVAMQERGTVQKRHLYRNTLLSLAKSEKEKEAVAFLIREELRTLGVAALSAQADTLPFNRVRIASVRSFEAVKLLALAGELVWKGKKILVDPFTLLEMQFTAREQDEGGLFVEGHWRAGALHDGPLVECDWVFPGEPAWMIAGGMLRIFSDKVPGKWLDLVYPSSSFLEGQKKERFLDTFSDTPHLVWKKKAQDLEEVEILPFLQLSDRTGAFANLHFDYGKRGKIAAHDLTKSVWRNREKELFWEKDLLETDFVKKIVDNSHFYCPLDKVGKSLTFLLEIGWPIYDYKGREIVQQKEADLSLTMDKEKLLLQGKIHYGSHKADLTDVVGAFNRRERFIDLSPDKVGLLDSQKIETLCGELGEEEIVSQGVVLKREQIGALSALFSHQEIKSDLAVKRLKEELEGSREEGPALPGADFKGVLHTYQQEGVNWLHFLYSWGFHGLLADEMGLGKTVQVLAFFSRLERSLPILVIVPTSLLFNWQREIEKFLPKEEVYIHSGSMRVCSQEELQKKRWILTSYALLRQDFLLFQSLSYESVILDEAQYIKNSESVSAQCVFKLQARFRLAITGTPIENRWEDLWSLFHFLLPKLLEEKKEFNAKMQAAIGDKRFLKQLQKRVRPFILRRKKEAVAQQLPAKIEQTVWVDMDSTQKIYYEDYLAKSRAGLLKKIAIDGAAPHRMEILETILRLRQICCHPQLIDGSGLQESAKLERVLVDLEEIIAEGRKVLVYSQFTQMLQLIKKESSARGWPYLYLDGNTKDREENVQKFQEDPTIPLFLISLKAGGVGLNLTAADYVILFDPWWNEAVEAQAIDRAHRIGRKATVIARRYVTTFTIEEKIMRLKEKKAAMTHSLLEFEENVSAMNADDLLELLS